MKPFPVSSSILSAAHLAAFVKDNYGLAGDVTCSLVKAGINHSYLIQAGEGKYIFRVYSLDWRTKEEILEEIRLLQHLSESGMSVSYALADSSGGYVQELAAPEGMRLGVLFTYAAGEKLIDAPDEVHRMIGRQMALMHRCSEGFGLKRVSYTPEVLLCESFRYLEPFLPADTAEMSFMRSARDYLFAELNQADDTQLPCGAVHLDMWFDNLVVDGETITVFDFDFCGNGWLCTDVAYYLMQLHALTPDEAACARKTERFLEGYESVAPLSAEERRLLPHLGVSLYFFYLGEQCRRFDNWSNVFINDVYLKRYITVRVKKYFDHHFNSSAVLG